MTERAYWNDHVRPSLGPFGRLVRVENAIENGTPDVAYCLRARPREPAASGWIELKWLDALPARPATPLIVEHLTLEQVQFLEGWGRAGGRAWLLMGAFGGSHFLLGPVGVRELFERRLTAADAAARAVVHGAGAFPAGRVLSCLCRGI